MVLAVDAAAVGVGYLFGPPRWSSSGTLAVVRDLGVPMPLWGGLFAVVGLLLVAAATARPGHALGTATYGFWGTCQLATAVDGDIQAWGNPWHTLAVAGFHAVGLWRAAARRAAGRNR